MVLRSNLEDAIQQESVSHDASVLHERLAQRDRRINELTSALKRVTTERDEMAVRLDFTGRLGEAVLKPPAWAQARKSTKNQHHATVNLMLSDLHFDEVVLPQEVDYLNAYNREIAIARLRCAIDGCIKLTDNFFAGLTYDGAVLMLNGDILSGIIHEMDHSNEDEMLSSALFWEEQLATAIDRMASRYGKLLVPCETGNHGRLDVKMPSKKRNKRNIEWSMYHHIARYFKDNKSITWMIPESPRLMFQVYDFKVLMEHGDAYRGGSGIAGAMSPLLLGAARTARVQMAAGKPYDLQAVGHFHQYAALPGRGILINGSLKGWDEYASKYKFEPEPAQQAFWLTTPEHGMTFSAPIVCQDREREGW